MKATTLRASRAVRMYVPMQAPPATWSHKTTVATQEEPTSSEVRTGHRLTDAILRTRQRQRQQQQQRPQEEVRPCAAPLPIPPPSHATTAPVKTRTPLRGESAGAHGGSEALRLALSYGRSALLTHLAHQQDDAAAQRPYAYSEVDWACVMGEETATSAAGTAPSTLSRVHRSALRPSTAEDGALALSWEMEQTWAALDHAARVRWMTSTPQGRQALRQAMAAPTETAAAVSDAGVVPSMCEMLSKYADALVRPRQPRTAALAPAPQRHHLQDLFAEEAQGSQREHHKDRHVSQQQQVGEAVLHNTTPDNANRASLRLKAETARAVEREKVWLQNLAACLGGDNAVKFVNDVKSLQRPREDNGESDARGSASNGSSSSGGGGSDTGSAGDASLTTSAVKAALSERDCTYSPGLLELCEELGIRSPRRAYVLSRVLRQVDEATTTAQPIPLSQVRELTTRYAAQYDREVGTIAANARTAGLVSPEKAVSDFEKYQLELAVDGVQVRLSKFQDDVPLLRNCTSVFNK